MWLFAQIFFYLVVAFVIGAVGSWILRGRMAEEALSLLRDRFKQMVSSAEMERDAARLRVRELARQVEQLEARLEGRPADGSTTTDLDVTEEPAARVENGAARASTVVRAAPDPDPTAPSSRWGKPLEEEAEQEAEALGPGREVDALAPEEEAPAPEPDEEAPELEPQADAGAPEPEAEAPEPEAAEPEDTAQARPPEPEAAAPAASSRSEAPAPELPEPPAGGGHPLSHLGEVPPEVANHLRSMGIHDTTDLYRHFQNGSDPGALARELHLEPRRVRRWSVLAELMEVPDVAPENAWLLEISGVVSLSELAAEDPGELADRMAGLNADQGLDLPLPSQDQVASWVLWASQAGAFRP